MSPSASTIDDYRAQLRRCAQALAAARPDALAGDVHGAGDAARLKMFTDGNCEKRFEKLQDQLEVLADFADDLDDLLEAYIRAVPLAAYDTGARDGLRFLDWLENRRPLSSEECDACAVLRGRGRVEELAERERLRHVRFQEALSAAEVLLDEWGTNDELRLIVNPIHDWETFRTRAFLEEDDPLPARVAFFPVGNDIRTAVLEPEAEALLRRLAASGPSRLDELARRGAWEREEIAATARDLIETGLAALQ
ncbi:MAG: hypothetical protein WD069_06490 [Planctomycetales bacterium]